MGLGRREEHLAFPSEGTTALHLLLMAARPHMGLCSQICQVARKSGNEYFYMDYSNSARRKPIYTAKNAQLAQPSTSDGRCPWGLWRATLQVSPSGNNGEPATTDMLLLSTGTVPGHGMPMCKLKQPTIRTYQQREYSLEPQILSQEIQISKINANPLMVRSESTGVLCVSPPLKNKMSLLVILNHSLLLDVIFTEKRSSLP